MPDQPQFANLIKRLSTARTEKEHNDILSEYIERAKTKAERCERKNVTLGLRTTSSPRPRKPDMPDQPQSANPALAALAWDIIQAWKSNTPLVIGEHSHHPQTVGALAKVIDLLPDIGETLVESLNGDLDGEAVDMARAAHDKLMRLAKAPTPAGNTVPSRETLLSILDDADAALATLFIGRDHGITPQAEDACKKLVVRVRDALAKERPEYAATWAESRDSWTV